MKQNSNLEESKNKTVYQSRGESNKPKIISQSKGVEVEKKKPSIYKPELKKKAKKPPIPMAASAKVVDQKESSNSLFGAENIESWQ